jgi:hypothetical protein
MLKDSHFDDHAGLSRSSSESDAIISKPILQMEAPWPERLGCHDHRAQALGRHCRKIEIS